MNEDDYNEIKAIYLAEELRIKKVAVAIATIICIMLVIAIYIQ